MWGHFILSIATILFCCENYILPCKCRQWGGFHKGRKIICPRAAALGQIIFLQWEFRGKALEPHSSGGTLSKWAFT